MLVKDTTQKDGGIAHSEHKKDLAVAVLGVVLSANDRGEECSIRTRVWQANGVMLDAATQGRELCQGSLPPVEEDLQEGSELALLDSVFRKVSTTKPV